MFPSPACAILFRRLQSSSKCLFASLLVSRAPLVPRRVCRFLVAATATYLANNQLKTWNGKSAAEDKNGNLTNDTLGNVYTWNDRNNLSVLAHGNDGEFV